MYSVDGYRALRQSAAVVRRGDRGVLAVTGADRLIWLQGLLTNDVAGLPAGAMRYSAYLTPQGRMITDMRVVNLADRTLLDVPGALSEGLRARLDGLLFAEDAQIADESHRTAIVELHGPAVEQVSDRARPKLTDIGADALRDDVFGVPAIVFFVPRDREDTLVAALVDAGAAETSLATVDVLRIEAGRPAFLVDMDEHTIPLEAGIEDRAISFTKGCYVGQEVIVRVTQRGQGRVAKKLVGVLFDKGPTPHAGNAIGADSRDIGRITSATWSPTLERPIALGYVHRDFVAPGTGVHVTTTEGTVPATIAALPFVSS
jgi:folate-binding protein YgfZ